MGCFPSKQVNNVTSLKQKTQSRPEHQIPISHLYRKDSVQEVLSAQETEALLHNRRNSRQQTHSNIHPIITNVNKIISSERASTPHPQTKPEKLIKKVLNYSEGHVSQPVKIQSSSTLQDVLQQKAALDNVSLHSIAQEQLIVEQDEQLPTEIEPVRAVQIPSLPPSVPKEVSRAVVSTLPECIGFNTDLKLSREPAYQYGTLPCNTSCSEKVYFCALSRPGTDSYSLKPELLDETMFFTRSFEEIGIVGLDPPKNKECTLKENQDSFSLKCLNTKSGNVLLLQVLDGHGVYGGKCSNFVCKTMLEELVKHSLVKETIYRDIANCCYEIDQRLINSEIDTFKSGSTAVFAVLIENSLYVANIGDSRIILGRKCENDNMEFRAVALSDDHKPNRPDERQRIINKGGRVFKIGVDRVWLSDSEEPGLAMSRSFGDVCGKKAGIISSPEFRVTQLDDKDAFLILATDGVWEFVQNEEAIEIVGNIYKAKQDAAEFVKEASAELMKRAISSWTTQTGDLVDDITCCVVKLK